MSGELRKIYYFASTHWDREWYQSFQGFRVLLVERIDEVLDVLEKDPSFPTFHFDGQTVLLDDYLKIMPQNRQKLVEFIRSGRIVVGPWYTMPDGLLVSGESLVRNLLIGHELSARHGHRAMKYGFLCDVFGHGAQMPQILRGFGISGALVGRGTNSHSCPAHFLWEAPDGSRCVTFKVPESTGYASFWCDVYFENAGKGVERMVESAIGYVERERERSDVPYVVLMDGMDHERIHPAAPQIAAALSEAFGCPVVFDSLERLAEDVSAHAGQLPVKKGELIETAREITNHHMLIPHTLSSRYDIKKANDLCQTLYEKWLLPLAAMATAQGSPMPQTYLSEGYKYLAKCHAHDSICGCSIDRVHCDMHYRFRQAEAIASRLVDDRLGRTARNGGEEAGCHERLLSIFNPLPFARREAVTVNVDFPEDYPHRFAEYKRFEQRNAFRLIDADGREVPYNLLHVHRGTFHKDVQDRYRHTADVHRISFVAELPALGYAEYLLVPSGRPVRYLAGLATADNACENEFLRMSVNADGTMDLMDKRTGRQYRNLASYADSGEIGDGWHHVEPVSGGHVLSRGAPCSIALINDGPAGCTFEVVHRLPLPRCVERAPGQVDRSGRTEELVIRTRFTLGAESPFVEAETTVENNVLDHRLQLCIPTGIPTSEYHADQAFCFVRRQTGFDRGTGDWYERSVMEKPFESVVLKRDETGAGLAFLSAHGLHECSATDDADGSLRITLLRSFSKTHLTDGEPDGQLQGGLSYRYRLMPLGPQDDYSTVLQVRDSLQAGQKALTRPATAACRAQRQPPWLEVAGAVCTMVKPAENGADGAIAVRIVNYGDGPATAAITSGQPIASAMETNLLEEPESPAAVDGSTVRLQLAPWQIKTCVIKVQPWEAATNCN